MRRYPVGTYVKSINGTFGPIVGYDSRNYDDLTGA